MKKKLYQLSTALFSNTGSVTVIPVRVYDTLRDAEDNAKRLNAELSELLKDAVLMVAHKNGEAQPLMPLGDFLSNFLRASAIRTIIGELIHDDGAPEILLPKPSGIIVPG